MNVAAFASRARRATTHSQSNFWVISKQMNLWPKSGEPEIETETTKDTNTNNCENEEDNEHNDNVF